MNDNQILEEIKKFLNNKNLKLEDNLRNLGIDSLDLLDLILEAEDKFDIRIEDDELLNLETINDVVKVIKTKL